MTQAAFNPTSFQTPEVTTGEIPKVTAVRWHLGNHSWAAYQLANGIFVMSDRQMGLVVNQPKLTTRDFVKTNNLPTITVAIPNSKVIKANPLTTVAAYCKYLLENNSIWKDWERFDWYDLINALEQSSIAPTKSEKPQLVWKPARVKTLCSASLIQVCLIRQEEGGIFISVVALSSGEYRIAVKTGLDVIGIPESFLQELEYSLKKRKALFQKSFSGLLQLCDVQMTTGVEEIETLSIDDWLTICEYFANKGNTKATAILKACAICGIPQRAASEMRG